MEPLPGLEGVDTGDRVATIDSPMPRRPQTIPLPPPMTPLPPPPQAQPDWSRPEPEKFYAQFADAAYNPRKYNFTKYGFEQDAALSDRYRQVYHNPTTKETVVAGRGTKLTDVHDLITDLAIGFGGEMVTPRFQTTKNIIEQTMEKYGNNVTLTGHSMGGLEAVEMGNKFGLTSYSYNPAIIPHLNPTHTINFKSMLKHVTDAHGGKTNVYITGYDPISAAAFKDGLKYNVNLRRPKSWNVHSMSNFL